MLLIVYVFEELYTTINDQGYGGGVRLIFTTTTESSPLARVTLQLSDKNHVR